MTVMREYLAAELARKVSQKGVVIWNDAEREYAAVAASLCPTDVRFVAYEGSWYALRREVEPLLSGDMPPKLLIRRKSMTEANPQAMVNPPLKGG